MSTRRKSRRIRLSVARRMVTDYVWMASGVARVDATRRVAVQELILVRQRLREPPSWTAMFVKAFAAVAQDIPELRRSYMKWPWPHLYEYADSTAVVMHEREIMGDIGILPLRFHQPNSTPLKQLSEMIRAAVGTATADTSFHRKLIAVARLPLLVRRLIWGLSWNIPQLRKEIGTYAVSSVARWQTELGTTRSPQTCLLSYGPTDSNGAINVRLNFDHRVFDGALAARVLARLEQVLNSSILEELHGLAKSEAAHPAA
jgi:hypothetical protein